MHTGLSLARLAALVPVSDGRRRIHSHPARSAVLAVSAWTNLRETMPPKFSLGQIVATPGTLAALQQAGHTPLEFISRHVSGDWGELDEEDRRENEFSGQGRLPHPVGLYAFGRHKNLDHH